MATLKIMGTSGHSTIEYDPEVEDQVAPARDRFNELVGGGFRAFVVAPGTRRIGTEVKEFDPRAHETILTHPIVGG